MTVHEKTQTIITGIVYNGYVDTTRPSLKTGAPVILCGAASMLVQVVCIRQFLVVLAGNELVMGVVIAVWLAAVAAGSLLARRFTGSRAFAASLVAAGILGQVSVLAAGSARNLLALGPGETVSLAATIGITALCLLPPCLAIGMAFPLAASSGGAPASRVYGLEAAGSFLGGIAFTLLLSGRLGSYPVAALAAALFIAAGVMVLRDVRCLLLLLLPALLYPLSVQLDTRLSRQWGRLVSRTESRYGEITVYRREGQLNFFESGKFLYAYPDPETDELRIHLPVSVHPRPDSVLLMGGSPGAAAVLARYAGMQVDYVEADPALISVSLAHLMPADLQAVRDRVRVIGEDGRRFVKRAPRLYDLIVMDLPGPSSAAVNRLYTADFFREARAVLRPGGILCLKVDTSSGYVGRRMRTVNGSIFGSLRAVFPVVAVSSEEYGCFLASAGNMDTSAATLAARFLSRKITAEHFRPFVFSDAFDPLKADMVRSRLASVDIMNTDARPVAYLYGLMLWADVHGRFVNRLLDAAPGQMAAVFGAAAVAVCLLFRGRRQAVYISAATTGYSSMAFSVVVLLSYQAAFGHVYEMVGLLSAFFMAGMAAGSLAAGRGPFSLRRLRLLEAGAAVFFLISPHLFGGQASFAASAAACGAIGGACFGAASGCLPGPGSAGRVYAADLAGSFGGALLSALIFIPLAGGRATLISLAGMKSLSLLLLLTVKDEPR